MNPETISLDPELQNENKSIEQSFQCPKCSFKTSKKHYLDQHLNGHNDCQLCGEVFLGSNGRRKLASHMKTHEVKPKKQQLCVFCNKEYKDRRILNRHLKICKKNPRDDQPNVWKICRQTCQLARIGRRTSGLPGLWCLTWVS